MKQALGTDIQAHLDRLRGEHAALEKRLRELESHLSLSPAEQRERAELKKIKLQLKDDIFHWSKLGN